MTAVDNSSRAVLITGGASGLGEATALYFTSQGHPVVVLDRDEQKCAVIGKRLANRGAVVCGSILEELSLGSNVSEHNTTLIPSCGTSSKNRCRLFRRHAAWLNT